MRHVAIFLLCTLTFATVETIWGAATNEAIIPGPQITAEVHWGFSEGSREQMNDTPDRWVTTLIIRSNDDTQWTALPDMMAGEAVAYILTSGICTENNLNKRARCVSFELQPAPRDTTGTSEKNHRWVLSPYIVMGAYKYAAHWKLNGKERTWQATELKKGDRLDCEWDALLTWALKKEVREKPDHYVISIGPILYDKSDPGRTAYVLVARSDKREGGNWVCSQPRFLPLTSTSILREMKDTNNTVDWRSQLLVLLWDQPRPCADADDVILSVLKDARTYPSILRKCAAYNLIERQHAPSKPILISLAADKKENADFRTGLIKRLSVWPGKEALSTVSRIAKDNSDNDDVRKAAAGTLAELGEQGCSVLEELKQDKVVGDKAKELLKQRQERDHTNKKEEH